MGNNNNIPWDLTSTYESEDQKSGTQIPWSTSDSEDYPSLFNNGNVNSAPGNNLLSFSPANQPDLNIPESIGGGISQNNTNDSETQKGESSDESKSSGEEENLENDESDSMENVSNVGDTEFPYITRGAMLKCAFGSHTRRLDMATDHGMQYSASDEEIRHPIATEIDCILETDDPKTANIKKFGICKAPNQPDTETIYLIEQDGEKMINGKECDLCMKTTRWQNVKTDMKINNYSPLKPDSYLICSRGALIEIESSGAEYQDE